MGSRSHDLYKHLLDDLRSIIGGDVQFDLTDYKKHFDPWPGISTKQFACISLLNSLFKKFEDDISKRACDKAALDLFLKMNDRCKNFADINLENASELDSMAVDYSLNEIARFCEDEQGYCLLNANNILSNLDVGPGASVGVSGNSFFHKFFGGPRTVTSASLSALIETELRLNPTLWEAEETRAAFFGKVQIVDGSSLSFALKNGKISRVICTEPSENMKFQKGIQQVMEQQLRARFGIDLSYQPAKNAMLAKIGSISGTFGTTDSRSASDTISLQLCRRRLPPAFFGWLNASRSPRTQLPGNFGGESVELHMISSMGNAFTFPLQTMLFASVVIGCYKALDIPIIYPRGGPVANGGCLGNFGVFGDDVVVRREAYNLVNKTLERFGFLVNHDKSYNSGDFRESCGSDYKSGHDVRGVYCGSLKRDQDVYVTYNSLCAWACNQGIPLNHSIAYLRGLAHDICVPPYENADAGYWTPLMFAHDVSIDPNGSVLYSAYSAVSRKLRIEKRGRDRIITAPVVKNKRTGKKMKPFFKPYCLNSAGFVISASAGYARGGAISLRSDPSKPALYQILSKVSPGWDWVRESDGVFTRRGFERWCFAFAR